LNLVLSPGTQAKVKMLTQEECLPELRKVIPDDSIPPPLGGASTAKAPPGGKLTDEIVKEIEAQAVEEKRPSLAKRISKRLSQSIALGKP